MGTTVEKLNYSIETKELQKAYLIEQGQNVNDETPFREYLEHFKALKPNLQDKSIDVTSNGSQTVNADEGYDGLNSVTIKTNVDTTSNLAVQRACMQKLTHNATKKFTIPAGKKYAIISCVINSQYNTPWGSLTCTASKGTISQLHNDTDTSGIELNTRLQVFKLTNTTGEASTVTLTMNWETGNGYGDLGTNFVVSY